VLFQVLSILALIWFAGAGTTAAFAEPDLVLTMSAVPNPVTSGTASAFVITITNSGADPAANVTVTDVLPGSLPYLTCTTTVGTCSATNGTFTASLGTLAPTGTVTINLWFSSPTVVSPTSIVDTASVATTTPESVTGNNQASTTLIVNPLAGPPGAVVQAFATTAGVIYAGTEGAGLFKSTDQGANWNPIRYGYANLILSVRAILLDPVTPSTVYIATGFGVSKSTDSGTTWNVPVNNGMTNTNMFAMTMDPTNSSTFFAGTAGGIFKSVDATNSWVAANTGLNTSFPIDAIAIDSTNHLNLYAASQGAGVFKSTDGGATWAASNSGLTGLTVRSLVIDPSTATTIYAATSSGVFKSTNSGGSWTPINNGLSNANFVSTLTIDSSAPGTIYAAGVGVFRSTNGGTNWSALNSGLGNTQVRALTMDPSNHATLYAGTGWGVFKSTNSGTNWNESDAGISGMRIFSLAIDPGNPSTLYAASDTGGGVFKTTDGGATWARGGLLNFSPFVRALALDTSNPPTLYAAHSVGISKSTVAAVNWNFINFNLSNPDGRSLAIDPTNSSVLYMGTTSGGVFKSTNGGGFWNNASGGPVTTSPFVALAIDHTNTQVIYAGSQGQGVFKSTNGGNSWNAINNGLTNTNVNALVIDFSNTLNVYAGTSGGGVFKSTNGGTSWAPMVNGLGTNPFVSALAQDPTNSLILYAGTFSGVFKSTDGAGTWNLASTGLTRPDARAFAINPSNPSIIYAGTAGGGVFKSTDGAATWQPTGTTRVNLPAQLSVFVSQTPNPVTSSGTVAFNIQGTNLGGTAADNVVLTFNIPTGVTFLSCNITCNNTNGVVTASVGTIGAGASSTLIVTGSVAFTASPTNVVTNGTVSTTTTQISTITNVGAFTVTINPPAGPPSANVLTISPHPTDPTSYLAGTNGGGVFKSSNSGATWVPSSAGLTGLFVRALVRVPGSPLTVFAGTNAGMFKATDGGITWTPFNFGLGNTNVFSVAADPAGILYAGTPSGVFKSTNSGSTWSPVNSGLNTSFIITAIVVNPSTPATIYAATAGAGIFKTTNSGGTWSAVNTNLTTLDVEALAMDPTNSNILYAGTNGGGIFKSTDGSSWSAANNGIPTPANSVYQTLLINAASPLTVYAGAQNQLIKSTDGGASWTSATSGLVTPNALSSQRIYSLVFDPSNSSTLLAGTGAGVFKSLDASGTWNASTAGLDAANITAITVDPHNTAIVYAGANQDAWYKSLDAGKTWSAANSSGLNNSRTGVLAIDPSNSAIVYVGGRSDGVYQSTNGGFSWTAANTGISTATVSGLIIDPSNTAVLFAAARSGGASGIFKTTNSGASWTAMNNGLTNTDVRALVFDGVSTMTLYAGTFGGGVFKSLDGGASWNPMVNGLTNLNVNCLAFDAKDNILYAGTNGGGVFSSGDGGATWFNINFGLINTTVQALAVASAPHNNPTVYAGTPGGLFVSYNPGQSWDFSTNGLGTPNVTSITVDPVNPNVAYAGLNGGGLFKSTDSGNSWQPSGAVLVPFPAPGTPEFLSVSAGSPQSAVLNTAFGTALQALVRDSTNSPVSGISVTFSVPLIGPSGTFPGSLTSAVAVTNALGVATAPTLTANAVPGVYLATASAGGSIPPVNYALTNVQAVSSATYSIPDRGGMVSSTAGLGAATAGYATIVPDNGKTTPAGFAVTDLRSNGILISEWTIPALAPISGGRLYVNLSATLNTGFVVANRNGQSATLSWSTTDLTGTDVSSGTLNVGANSQIGIFLTQSPFNMVSPFEGTMTFSSNVPVAISGIRLLTNERSESIVTATPVFDTSLAPGNGTAISPVVPDGEGLATSLILENPTDTTLTGNILLSDEIGAPIALTANGQTASSFPYSIPRRSSFRLTTTGTSQPMINPVASVVPTSGQNTPWAFAIASNRQNNVTVSEAGGTATSGTALRTYVESSFSATGDFTMDTFVAIANATANAGQVTIAITDLAGNTALQPFQANLPANGQFGFQLHDIFNPLPDLKGVLRITSTTTVTATAFRLHQNERGDLLLASMPVVNENATAPTTPLIIPSFGDGGGYTAEFVVFSGYANQSTTGQLQFTGQSGTPLNLDLNAKPSILTITPAFGILNTMVNATINGANLAGATAVTFSGTGVTASIGAGGTSTSLPITITIDPLAQATTRTVTVTTTAGTSVAFSGFSVTTGRRRGGQVTSQ
jgi:uncharacterized repeat protein (TIGR01451 family)